MATLALFVSITCACEGRRKDLDAYANEMCACKDGKCVVDVEKKYAATLQSPRTWTERHLVSGGARSAMDDAMRRATACAAPFTSPEAVCGGEAGRVCPPGFRCSGLDESIPDAQGHCVEVEAHAAKDGEPCIVDGNGCATGLQCMRMSKQGLGRCMQPAPKNVVDQLGVDPTSVKQPMK